MNNREKIIGGDSLWRPTEATKKPIFERFFLSFYLKVVNGEKFLTLIVSLNQYLQFLQKTFFEKTTLSDAIAENAICFTPPIKQKSESPPRKLLPSLY